MTNQGVRHPTAAHPAMFMRAIALCLLCAATSVSAASALNIRLIAANNDGSGIPAALSDIAPLLQANLPFSRFDLLDKTSLPLPANGGASLARDISVQCFGPTDNLRVTVHSGTTLLVDTTLRLADFRPIILGGFPYERGRLLLVIVAK